jgi:3-oxoacyl-[acyl-carrier-protein] synthase-1
MKRVVVTGMGIWSCLGQDLQTVTESLKHGRSGIVFDPKRIEYGLQSGLVGNVPRPDLKPLLPRKFRATMSEDSEYAYMAARQAFEQAGISDEYLTLNEVGIMWGNDSGAATVVEGHTIIEQFHESIMLGPTRIFQGGASSAVMNMCTIFHLKGCGITTAAGCASSSHAIGLVMLLVQIGKQDMVLVGGSSEIHPMMSAAFDATNVLSLCNNDSTHASRPFDKDRDGMVFSGGAAALVLEEYEHAVARGATILAEVCGYGFSSNGIEDISMPSANAEYIAMKRALDDAGLQPSDIDYVNAHATSTIAGDIEEAKALTRLFAQSPISNLQSPMISSTKSMTGHENWMAGASEAVYSILMMQNNFVAPNINLEHRIDEARDLNIVTETVYAPIHTVLSNSSGMGGTNSALVFCKIGS